MATFKFYLNCRHADNFALRGPPYGPRIANRREDYFFFFVFACFSSTTACAAASRAIGTRNGEALT